MSHLRKRKAILLTIIAITAFAPLLCVEVFESPAPAAAKVLAKTGSLVGTVLLLWQVLLGFRGFAAVIVPDVIWMIEVHKKLGIYGACLILLHPIFITIYYFQMYEQNIWAFNLSESFDVFVLLGLGALLVLGLVVVTSVFMRKRLGYRRWYTFHLSSYLILPLVFVHSLPIGQTVGQTSLYYVWWGLAAITIGLFTFRLVGRLGWMYEPYEVCRVDRLGPDVVEVGLKPLKRGIDPRVGQFIYIRHGLRGTVHPYTISHFSPQSGSLHITIKALGPGSSRMQHITPGARILVDGPYGVFGQEALRTDRPVIMVAGGIGITSFIRLIEHLEQDRDREALLLYGNVTPGDIVYADELDALKHVKVVHVISGDNSYEGETGLITSDLMKKHAGRPLGDYIFLICGPAAMIHMITTQLAELGVNSRQIYHELFEW